MTSQEVDAKCLCCTLLGLFAFVREWVSLEIAILAMLTGHQGLEILPSAPSRAGITDCQL